MSDVMSCPKLVSVKIPINYFSYYLQQLIEPADYTPSWDLRITKESS